MGVEAITPEQLVRDYVDYPEGAPLEEKLKSFDPLAIAVSGLMDSAKRIRIWSQAEADLQGTYPSHQESTVSIPTELEDDIATLELLEVTDYNPGLIEQLYFIQPLIRSLGFECYKCSTMHGERSVRIRSGEAWVLSDEVELSSRRLIEDQQVEVSNEDGKLAGFAIGNQIEIPRLNIEDRLLPAETTLEVRVRIPGRNRVATGEPSSSSGYRECLLLPANSTDLIFADAES